MGGYRPVRGRRGVPAETTHRRQTLVSRHHLKRLPSGTVNRATTQDNLCHSLKQAVDSPSGAESPVAVAFLGLLLVAFALVSTQNLAIVGATLVWPCSPSSHHG
jgi:hypothetical protein